MLEEKFFSSGLPTRLTHMISIALTIESGMKPTRAASRTEYDTKHSFQSWKGLEDKVEEGLHSEGRKNDSTCDLIHLGFCQTNRFCG